MVKYEVVFETPTGKLETCQIKAAGYAVENGFLTFFRKLTGETLSERVATFAAWRRVVDTKVVVPAA